ncbi:copper amine oxidase N-terminal domain-containing protein [Cohnella cholangitidis]|uniref:Copper amine oxidase N-terminal domain-containing protein n=1 Tax=Cohnella cholangitidis TaxID=2598458 RepID=A0A7G5BV25_9BACL|nr:copper amine oxidase N-terminal domain-containing protein [Cohnella cholangitidis]QMV40809.1 copper amine oxidase N-terminal domain-containing protein [Cohnella cholangitidis]
MKNLTAVFLILIIVLLSVGSAGAATVKPDVTFIIDGKPFKTPKGEPEPYVNKDKRTMVSIRFFSSAIGMTSKDVKWNNKTQTVTLKRNGDEATIVLGSSIMKVNGASVTMDTQAEMKNGRLFIPVRYAAIALGVYFEWDGDKKLISINSKVKAEPIPTFEYKLPSDEIFDNKEKLNQLTSYPHYFIPENGKFLFRVGENGSDPNYTLKETLIPDLNRRLYDATKVLLDDNNFVGLKYDSDGVGEYPERVFLSYSKGPAFDARGNHLFQFILREEEAYSNKLMGKEFSDNASILFVLERLYRDKSPSGWVDPFYANKMKSAFIALFGMKDGSDIADYVLNHYVQKRLNGQESYKSVKQVKTFGNIQVDFYDSGEATTLDFVFSFKR